MRMQRCDPLRCGREQIERHDIRRPVEVERYAELDVKSAFRELGRQSARAGQPATRPQVMTMAKIASPRRSCRSKIVRTRARRCVKPRGEQQSGSMKRFQWRPDGLGQSFDAPERCARGPEAPADGAAW